MAKLESELHRVGVLGLGGSETLRTILDGLRGEVRRLVDHLEAGADEHIATLYRRITELDGKVTALLLPSK